MLDEIVGSLGIGAIFGLSVASPAEWAIHRYLLHASSKFRKKNKFIEGASRGHNDIHHGAYKAPEHYYRDVTNENEIIHFAKSDVGIIAGVAGVAGGLFERAGAFILNSGQFDTGSVLVIAGTIAGTMAYYGCYEFTHHYMHVIGERRLSINRTLGDIIQGGVQNRDGNLRLSKPLLDEVCDAVEMNTEEALRGIFILEKNARLEKYLADNHIVQRLENQIEYNRSRRKAIMPVKFNNAEDMLFKTQDIIVKNEGNYLNNLNWREKLMYNASMAIQKILRSSPAFKYLDNHHYIHHRKYGKNLNVVFPLMDYFMKTKENSKSEFLEENKEYWLCPNSPDMVPFQKK